MMDDPIHIAIKLLELKAVAISPHHPYRWASGLHAPIYCDNRLIMSHVPTRREVVGAFVRLFEARDWRPEVVAGTATAGIPHAAWLAEALSLPMVYVRGAEKKHGKQNRIEGALPSGASAVVIEDLISTGGSVIQAAGALRDAGAAVLGVAAIFQYGLARARRAFAEANLDFATLTSLEHLLKAAIDQNWLAAGDRVILENWRKDPGAWSRAWEEKNG